MSRRALVAGGLIGAALCFSLGWLASRAVETPKREPTSIEMAMDDAGVGGPLLLIDPSKVLLLPDASLNFDPPKPLTVP